MPHKYSIAFKVESNSDFTPQLFLTGNLIMIEKLVLGGTWTGDLPIFRPDALTSASLRQGRIKLYDLHFILNISDMGNPTTYINIIEHRKLKIHEIWWIRFNEKKHRVPSLKSVFHPLVLVYINYFTPLAPAKFNIYETSSVDNMMDLMPTLAVSISFEIGMLRTTWTPVNWTQHLNSLFQYGIPGQIEVKIKAFSMSNKKIISHFEYLELVSSGILRLVCSGLVSSDNQGLVSSGI